jgi:hypothetical protein
MSTNTIDCSSNIDSSGCSAANERAKEQNKELEAEFSTKYTHYLYQLERNHLANFYIFWLYWIYAIIAVLFVYFLIRGSKSSETTWTMKIVFVLIVVLFPFLCVPIELNLKDIIVNIYDMTLGKPIQKTSDWKIIGENKVNAKYGIKDSVDKTDSGTEAARSSAPVNWLSWS